MNDDASAKRPKPKNFPAAIPRTMTTNRQREEIERVGEAEDKGLGETVRYLIELGLASHYNEN